MHPERTSDDFKEYLKPAQAEVEAGEADLVIEQELREAGVLEDMSETDPEQGLKRFIEDVKEFLKSLR